MPIKFTHQQMITNECSDKEYWEQFLDESVLRHTSGQIGLDRILASEDYYLNDIPLKEWDRLGLPSHTLRLICEANGGGFSLSDTICVHKTAGRLLRKCHGIRLAMQYLNELNSNPDVKVDL